MYSFIKDLREIPFSQSFPPTGFIPRTFRSKIDFFKYNQLPPIKEEEGNISHSKIDLTNLSLGSESSNDTSYDTDFETDVTNSTGRNKKKKLTEKKWTKSEVSPLDFSPSVNVNCLMNVNMKQQSIWNTRFGKRLINGKVAIPETMSLPTMKKPQRDVEKNQRSKSTNSSQYFLRGRNTEFEDKMTQRVKKKTKPVKVRKKFTETEEREKDEEKPSQTDMEKAESDITKVSMQSDISSSQSLTNPLTTSSKSRNQKLLTHCVQNILGGVTVQYTCEFCNETFTDVEEYDDHKKKHEREKDTCILCNKVFYNSKEFAQHLLTHESVDRFSCKKCKTYFPSLKKYKAHCEQVHLMTPESTETENTCSLRHVNTETPEYECKRCQLKLDSEENMRLHRRNHIRLDLMGAYLLSNKSI